MSVDTHSFRYRFVFVPKISRVHWNFSKNFLFGNIATLGLVTAPSPHHDTRRYAIYFRWNVSRRRLWIIFLRPVPVVPWSRNVDTQGVSSGTERRVEDTLRVATTTRARGAPCPTSGEVPVYLGVRRLRVQAEINVPCPLRGDGWYDPLTRFRCSFPDRNGTEDGW